MPTLISTDERNRIATSLSPHDGYVMRGLVTPELATKHFKNSPDVQVHPSLVCRPLSAMTDASSIQRCQ